MAADKNVRQLLPLACVVKLKCQNSTSENSASGTVVDPHQSLVISHGSILSEFIATNQTLLSKVKNGRTIKPSDILGTNFSLLLSNQTLSSKKFYEQNPDVPLITRVSSSADSKNSNSSDNFTEVKCRFVTAFRNEDFHKTLQSLMPEDEWKFADNSSHDENNISKQSIEKDPVDNDLAYQLLSYFLLFDFSFSNSKIPKHSLNTTRNFSLHSWQKCPKCCVGDTAEIVATPFAAVCPSVFFNGYSRGVISNVSGKNDCWIVTDARCIPGSEGGPMFAKTKPTDGVSYPSGVIASSLCWKSNDWIGLSVVCGMDSILNALTQCLIQDHGFEVMPRPLKEKFSLAASTQSRLADHRHLNPQQLESVIGQRVTVVVHCGQTWGSGVMVDAHQGIVLTCSHVLQGADTKKVTVTPPQCKSRYPAQVLYRQAPSTTWPYDVALVRCPQVAARSLKDRPSRIQVAPPVVGQEVFVSGHAVFSTDHGLEPTLCRGVVSKVIERKDKPVLIQTTCAVHAGVSGGPVLTGDGRLVGIAVCNTRDSSSESSFPHVNLCVPAVVVWPAIQSFLRTHDKKFLQELQVRDSDLQELWALGSRTCHDDCTEVDIIPIKSKL